MPMIVAVIDLGTNTFHLHIADISNGSFSTLHKNQIAVKLGQGGINLSHIAPQAYERGKQAMLEFKNDLEQYSPERLKAMATSALREANNGKEFINEIKLLTGIEIQLISGKSEAQYIFKGVVNTVDFGDEPFLVMDIGGGSVEFIIGNKLGPLQLNSFDVGCARLIEKYHSNDPISEQEIIALESHLEKELQPLMQNNIKVKKLVGSAGSFESLVYLAEELTGNKPERIHENCYKINKADFEQVYQKLIRSTSEERELMHGLADYRVEMIVVAVVLIRFIINKLEIEELYCSEFSLKEGIIFGMMEEA